MTIWHVQKSYYEVMPYALISTVKDTLKMQNGIKQIVKFLVNSRLSEKSAVRLADRKNLQLI